MFENTMTLILQGKYKMQSHVLGTGLLESLQLKNEKKNKTTCMLPIKYGYGVVLV